jgi:predicted RNA-binding Zn-ribbon protein involved in translation (DUF1610 family)
MSERKYRQRGYMDSGRGEAGRKRDEARRPPSPTFGPKAPQMPPSRTVSRCAACGAILSVAAVAPSDVCHKCGAALHACTQCAHFDPGSRFQCSKPVPEAIKDKAARNDCGLFELRTSVERDASSGAPDAAGARAGFDSLFKK